MAGGQDIAFNEVGTPEEVKCVDLKVVNGDYVADDGLENLAIISLFSNRFVEKEDLPANTFTQEGWWADDLLETQGDRFGSRLWIFDRIGKLNVETANGMEDACREALQWMIEIGLADRIKVSSEVVQNVQITLMIDIFRPQGDNIPLKFIWDAQEFKRVG